MNRSRALPQPRLGGSRPHGPHEFDAVRTLDMRALQDFFDFVGDVDPGWIFILISYHRERTRRWAFELKNRESVMQRITSVNEYYSIKNGRAVREKD